MMIIPSPPPGERARVRGRPRLRGHQLGDPEQVVGGGDEVSGELRALLPSESGLPEARDGLRPAEDLFDPLPDSLAYLVAGVANRPPVHRGAPPLVAGLRDVRRDSPLAASADEVGGVVAGVSSESDARGVRYVLVEPRQRADALAVTRGWVDAKVDEESVPVLHQRVGEVTQLGRLVVALARQLRLRIGRRGVRLVRRGSSRSGCRG